MVPCSCPPSSGKSSQDSPPSLHWGYDLFTFIKADFDNVKKIKEKFLKGHTGVWVFWALATQSPCLVSCNKPLHFPSPLPSISCYSITQLYDWTHVHWVSDAIQPSHHLDPFFSCPQSFPAPGSFPMSQLFTSGHQSIGALASVLPMNIQGWFPLGCTGLISLFPTNS